MKIRLATTLIAMCLMLFATQEAHADVYRQCRVDVLSAHKDGGSGEVYLIRLVDIGTGELVQSSQGHEYFQIRMSEPRAKELISFFMVAMVTNRAVSVRFSDDMGPFSIGGLFILGKL